MTEYLILFAIVLGVNLMPAFGPPTWSIIVLYGLNSSLPLPALVIVAAVAAALGRFLLAYAFRFFGDYVPEKTKRNVVAAGHLIERKKKAAYLALAMFALSPVPSAQLFEAAGLAKVRLLRFTLAFFFGRVVSYSIYGLTANRIAQSSFGEAFRESFSSPVGLAIQLAMIALLIGFTQIDWRKFLSSDGR